MAEETATKPKLKIKPKQDGGEVIDYEDKVQVDGEFTPNRRPAPDAQAPEMPEELFEMPEVYKGKRPEIMADWDAMQGDRAKLDQESDFRSLLVGATPLLAGFLGGNMGDGAEIAAAGLVQEDTRRQKQDETLMGLLKTQKALDGKKKAAGDKAARASNVMRPTYDPGTGELKWASNDELMQGKPTPERLAQLATYKPAYTPPAVLGDQAYSQNSGRNRANKEAHLHEVTVTGPQGQPLVRNRGELTTRPIATGAEPGGIQSRGHAADVRSLTIDHDKELEAPKATLESARKLRTMISRGEALSDTAALFEVVKAMQGKADRISDQDMRAVAKSGGLEGLIDKFVADLEDGKLPPKKRKQVLNLISDYEKLATEDFDRKSSSSIKSRAKLAGMTEHEFKKYLRTSRPMVKKTKPISDMTDEEIEAELKERKGRQ